MSLPLYVQASYLVVAILFILGLKGMSSPGSAKRGIVQAGLGMALAVLVTFALPGLRNIWFIVAALLVGVSDTAFKYLAPELGAFFIYALTMAILLWRPRGIFGQA